jgi:hypothetical protein
VPLDDAGLLEKFAGLVGPALGENVANALASRLWSIEESGDVALLIEAMAK